MLDQENKDQDIGLHKNETQILHNPYCIWEKVVDSSNILTCPT